jgi:hypothetical protein
MTIPYQKPDRQGGQRDLPTTRDQSDCVSSLSI